MLITDGGTLVRTRVNEISVVGRNTQGVTVIRLDKGEKVVGVDRVDGLGDEDDAEDADVDTETEINTDAEVDELQTDNTETGGEEE
jgi:DNA gyrase subunit A